MFLQKILFPVYHRVEVSDFSVLTVLKDVEDRLLTASVMEEKSLHLIVY